MGGVRGRKTGARETPPLTWFREMLASLRRGGFSRPKQLTSIERAEKNAAMRRRGAPFRIRSRPSSGSTRTSERWPHSYVGRRKRLLGAAASRLAQRATEAQQFKKWVRYRNPI